MTLQNTLAHARQLDEEDVLKRFRDEFVIPVHEGKDAIYFLGNSLGLQPKRAETYIGQVLKQWGSMGVEAFFRGEQPWLQLHKQLTPVLSKIVGAQPNEISVMNQLTVNLHLMLVSFYKPEGKRRKILCEAKAFPSDQYMLYTHVKQRGFNPNEIIIEVQPRSGEVQIREDDILAAIAQHRDELALVFWGGVNYYTGQLFDMAAITKAAHAIGARVGFDLAHAAGNIALQLHEWDVDFACWCSYKYLNSGPGAIAAVFIHERYHGDATLNRFAGWWGNKRQTQFLMQKDFEPESTAEGWQLSTPSPILYAAHKASLDVFAEAGVSKVFAKNRALNAFFRFGLEELKGKLEHGVLQVLTPKNQGCQVSMMVKNGKSVFDFLSGHGVYADWREPDVIRVAPVGLYNTFEEIWQFVQLLETAINKYAS